MTRILSLALLLALLAPVQAQTVLDQQITTTTQVIFYVKENEDSPYQGRLVFTPEDFAKLDAKQIGALQLEQFAAWKAALEVLRNKPPPTVDEKVDMARSAIAQKTSLDQQIAELRSDPAVAAKLDAPPDALMVAPK